MFAPSAQMNENRKSCEQSDKCDATFYKISAAAARVMKSGGEEEDSGQQVM